MRPIYMTDTDFDAETNGINLYATLTGNPTTPTDRLALWDAETTINGQRTLIEYKRRHYPLSFFQHNPLMLSAQKVEAMRSETTVAAVVLEADDGMVVFDAFDHSPPHRAGRTDRGDPNDIEPCVFYPMVTGEVIAEWKVNR